MEFIDLKKQYHRIKPDVDKAIINCMETGTFILGNEVTKLEQRLAEYTSRKHCISCSNGTDAITLALTALGVTEGDAVFIPSFTFFASAETVAIVRATPVFVDIDLQTYNISPEKLEEAIIKVRKEGKLNPKAIIPVDLFGLPCDYDAILAIAKKYDLYVIEDGAQGFGGVYNGKRNCSFGDISTTSFFPSKPLGCYGDGGAIFTDDDKIAELLISLRAHGKGSDKYDNVRIGLNARLDTIQACVLNHKMNIFDDELHLRNKVAQEYNKYLSNKLITPYIPENMKSAYAQYTLLLEDTVDREELMNKLKENGIPTMVYYPKPMHLQTAFKHLGYSEGDFPNSEKACNKVLSLPMHPYLTNEEIELISKTLLSLI